MPVPKYGLISTGAPAGHESPEVALNGLTELRVHGVGGTSPEALLNDLAPEQVAGDRIAGFYRTADYRPAAADSRHVEGYSWGGLTSRSSWRVFWLLLLPFLLGNLAGWMCSADTRKPGRPVWRFRLHRASAALACLALTINVVLVLTMITADVVAYQAARAGDAKGRWWLAPLRWAPISAYPARQVLLGVVVSVVIVILLAVLSARSRTRYEAVRPPYKGEHPPDRAPTVAATLGDGLSDKDFWDGEHSVQQSARRHVAASFAFLALVLAITSRQTVTAAHGAVHAEGWWWAAVIGGAAVIVLVSARTCIDFSYSDERGRRRRTVRLDVRSTVTLLVVAAAAIGCAGIFAWLQPSVTAQAGQLPGMAGIFRWTMTGVAATVGLVLLASIAGGTKRGTLPLGPLVTTVIAFSLLNVAMLGALLSIAHLIGNLAFAASAGRAQIYVPALIGFGTPALVIAAVIAAVLFAVAEVILWWNGRGRKSIKASYEKQYSQREAEQEEKLHRKPGPGDPEFWELSALNPPTGDDRDGGSKWVRGIARAQRIGHASRDAGWLLWVLAVSELAMVVVALVLQPAVDPDRWLGKAAIAIGTALPLFLVGLLRAGWGQQGKRRQIGVLWDVGTFWPRSYHPLAPPCYAERAVPDLQRRLWWLDDNGGCVLLAAHSQGAVLAAAALIQKDCLPDNDRAGLVTFGCPLGKLYSWAFPAYVSEDQLERLLGDGKRSWQNIYYPTDPIGGRIFHDVSAHSQPVEGPQEAGTRADCQAVDLELPDPAESRYDYGQPKPSPGGHSGYWTDARVWEQVAKIAAKRPHECRPSAQPADEP